MNDTAFTLLYDQWADPQAVLAELRRGADPDRPCARGDRVLGELTRYGTEQTLRMVLPYVTEVDAPGEGLDEERTALWSAVYEGQPGMARLLAQAGADPWREQLGGWSAGRLALAGPTPQLFGAPPAGVDLTADEAELRRRAATVVPAAQAAVDRLNEYGWSLQAVAGITAAEAERRLGGLAPVAGQADLPVELVGTESSLILATDVPGGCLLLDVDGYLLSAPVASSRLSAGGRSYGIYANAKSGEQGNLAVDGRVQGDLKPGIWPSPGDDSRSVLISYLAWQAGLRGSCIAEACLTVDVHPQDARAFTGPADRVFRLPEDVDWWRLPASATDP